MGRPFRYIVVEGPIGVGKTSLAHRLAAEFDGDLLLERPDSNPFLANFYANPRQYALSAQLHFLLQRSRQVQDFRQADLFRGAWVADFMVAKDRLFAELTLDADELALYDQIYRHLTLDTPAPDLVIYLQAPVDVLRERIVRRGIDYEQQIRDDYLQRLAEAYTRFFHDYDEGALLTINTQSVDLVGNADDYRAVVDKLGDIHSGRHYFNQSSFAL